MNVSPLPTDSTERKDIPMLSGVLNYFPAALVGVARISKIGNDQHNPGQPLHHARGKSMDHGDCIIRHTVDVEAWLAHIKRTGVTEEAVKILLTEARYRAWRSLADLQQLEETYGGAPLAPAARLPEEPVVKTEGVQTCMEQGPGQQGYCSRQKGHTGPHAAHQGHALHLVPYLYWGGNYHLTLQIHFGDAKDWHGTCDAADCWCLGTKHHTVKD